MNKLQLTFTDQEIGVFEAKAAEFGYDVTKFIKFELAKLFEKLNSESKSELGSYVAKQRKLYAKGKLPFVTDPRDII